MVEAFVQGQGLFLADGTERFYLCFKKSTNHGLPYEDGRKIPVTIVIGGKEYRGTIGARANLGHIYVGSQLIDSNGQVHKQTYVLLDNGFTKNQKVKVSVSGNRIVMSADVKTVGDLSSYVKEL